MTDTLASKANFLRYEIDLSQAGQTLVDNRRYIDIIYEGTYVYIGPESKKVNVEIFVDQQSQINAKRCPLEQTAGYVGKFSLLRVVYPAITDCSEGKIVLHLFNGVAFDSMYARDVPFAATEQFILTAQQSSSSSASASTTNGTNFPRVITKGNLTWVDYPNGFTAINSTPPAGAQQIQDALIDVSVRRKYQGGYFDEPVISGRLYSTCQYVGGSSWAQFVRLDVCQEVRPTIWYPGETLIMTTKTMVNTSFQIQSSFVTEPL